MISSSSTSSKVTNLLKFKELNIDKHIDPYEIFVQKTNKDEVSDSDFLVRLKVNAEPDVEAFVEIDKASGNVLSGQGNGRIELYIAEDDLIEDLILVNHPQIKTVLLLRMVRPPLSQKNRISPH